VTGIFLEGEDSRGNHGLDKLVELRFKSPPGTTSSPIVIHTRSGQRNYASFSSETQKAVTLQPCSRESPTNSTNDLGCHWRKIYTHTMSYIIYHNGIY